MNFTGIDRITYGVEDMGACCKFFVDWGLKEVSAESGGAVFETLDGTEIALRAIDDASLPPAIESGSTLREVVWGVESAGDLRQVRERIEALESFSEREGRPSCRDPLGMTISFRVSQRRDVEVASTPLNTLDRPDARVDRPSTFYDHAEPVRVGHVVFFVDDLATTEKFYRETFGFVVSDEYTGAASFLRCKLRGGHHNLFLLQTPDKKVGLNHVAFTVRDIHEVFGGGLHIDKCGWKTQIGPGRHPISSAYFWYVQCPAGALAEYYTDEDYLTENWKPRQFQRSVANFTEWAVDGGIDAGTRRQHLPE